MRCTAIALAILVLNLGFLAAQDQPDYFPDQAWRVSTPGEQGMDPGILAKLFTEIVQKKLDIHSVVIIRHGYKVVDANVEPFDGQSLHTLNSVTKSFVSALVGCALQDGYIKNLDQKVLDFFPGQSVENLDDAKRSMTIRHLLTMSSGIDMDNFGYRTLSVYSQADWAKAYLDRKLEYNPGTHFNYDNPGVDLLERIVSLSTGKDLAGYAEKRLFEPLGIKDYFWLRRMDGEYSGCRGLVLSTDSMARFGYLYLHGGRWKDKQVLPSDFARDSLISHVRQSVMLDADKQGYGYLWWEIPGGFAAEGWGGQVIMVYPEQDLVVVMTSNLGPGFTYKPIELATQYILPSLTSKNPSLSDALSKSTQDFENSQQVSTQSQPAWAAQGPGRTFQISGTNINIQGLTLKGENNVANLVFRSISAEFGTWRYILPIDNKFHAIKPSFHFGSDQVLARAQWTSPDTFIVEEYNQKIGETKSKYILRFSEPDICELMIVVRTPLDKVERVITAKAQLVKPSAGQ